MNKKNRKRIMTQRLKDMYENQIQSKLMKDFQYKNIHQVPKIDKIVINRGLGEAALNSKILESSINEISTIVGQKGILTRSKKAIAGFKLRQKMPIGIVVTLRGIKMYAFLDRLINLALPRIRDFQGVYIKSFDGQGNYSLGLEEQLMFPEIEYDQIDQVRGMDISLVTTAKNNAEGLALLTEFGMPFKPANNITE